MKTRTNTTTTKPEFTLTQGKPPAELDFDKLTNWLSPPGLPRLLGAPDPQLRDDLARLITDHGFRGALLIAYNEKGKCKLTALCRPEDEPGLKGREEIKPRLVELCDSVWFAVS